jgi:hypothetical protein
MISYPKLVLFIAGEWRHGDGHLAALLAAEKKADALYSAIDRTNRT